MLMVWTAFKLPWTSGAQTMKVQLMLFLVISNQGQNAPHHCQPSQHMYRLAAYSRPQNWGFGPPWPYFHCCYCVPWWWRQVWLSNRCTTLIQGTPNLRYSSCCIDELWSQRWTRSTWKNKARTWLPCHRKKGPWTPQTMSVQRMSQA